MDAAPLGARWVDEGFTVEEGGAKIHSTPVHDHDIMTEGFAPGIGDSSLT